MTKVNKLPQKINKEIVFEIISIIAAVVIVCLSLLSDLSILHIPDVLNLKIDNVEDLFFNLFTVQASIATLSIAIISIITGLVNDSYLGISISGYITNIKPKFFKHNKLIIFNLLITVLNYFCVAYALFNLSIALFVISVFVTILLVKGVCFIFLGRNKVKEEIQNYLLHNYNPYFLTDFNKELSNAIETGKSVDTNDCLIAIKKIFEKEIKINNYESTEIVSQLSHIVSDSFEKIVNQHNPKKIHDVLLFINDLYEMANHDKANSKILSLDIWDYIVRDYYRALKELPYEELSYHRVYHTLRRELYENLKAKKDKEIDNSYLKNYSARIYDSLFKRNERLNEIEKNYLKKDIYEEIREDVVYGNYTNESIKRVLIYEWCNLNKTMIDSGDTNLLQKHFFEHFKVGFDKTEYSLVYLITLIYLYYLAYRENLEEVEEAKKNAKKIIGDNKDKLEGFYYDINLISLTQSHYDFIGRILMSWEYLEEGIVKYVISNTVVEDFIVFSSITQFWNKEDVKKILQNIIDGSVFSIYNRYFEKNHVEYFETHYKKFIEMISEDVDDEEIQEKKNLLKDVLDEMYREEKIQESLVNAITPEKIAVFSQKLKEETELLVDKIIKPFNFQDEKDFDNLDICKKDNILISASIVPYFILKNDKIEQYMTKNLFSNIVTCFLNRIFEKIECHKVSYDDENKQQKLIDVTKNLHINPNVVIANRENFWNEEDKTLLKRFTSNMTRIEYPYGFNYYFILDSNLIEFSIDNLRIECEDLEWEEIKSSCREDEKGQLYFNVTNDFYIPFEKSEIEEYTSKTKKKVLIYADIKYRLHKEKVGAGIEITFDRENEND